LAPVPLATPTDGLLLGVTVVAVGTRGIARGGAGVSTNEPASAEIGVPYSWWSPPLSQSQTPATCPQPAMALVSPNAVNKTNKRRMVSFPFRKCYPETAKAGSRPALLAGYHPARAVTFWEAARL